MMQNCCVCGEGFEWRERPGRKPARHCSRRCRNTTISRAKAKLPPGPKQPLTLGLLRRLIKYDPFTGIFTRPDGSKTVAGFVNANGYRLIGINGKQYAAHRLAWFYMKGKWPSKALDHINMVRNDNRIFNLRECTMTQNRANTRARSDNTSGFKGVCWDPLKKRWRAQLQMHGKKITIGRFHTREEAHAAYAKAAELHFKEFARTA